MVMKLINPKRSQRTSNVEGELFLPPPVTRSANQVMTIDELLEQARNDSIGKSMTTKKHMRGTPRLVQYRRNLGALPSSARPYKLRVAQYV